MSDESKPKPGFLARLRSVFTTPIVVVQDVPPEVAACEFNCRATECVHGEWKTCDRRLKVLRESSGGPTPP